MTLTDEKDFQDQLDAVREDFVAYQVFADYLDESEDPRAAGYRAMGRLGLRPWFGDESMRAMWFDAGQPLIDDDGKVMDPESDLPQDWFRKLEKVEPTPSPFFTNGWEYGTQEDARNAAALAFLLLPEGRQRKLLGGDE